MATQNDGTGPQGAPGKEQQDPKTQKNSNIFSSSKEELKRLYQRLEALLKSYKLT